MALILLKELNNIKSISSIEIRNFYFSTQSHIQRFQNSQLRTICLVQAEMLLISTVFQSHHEEHAERSHKINQMADALVAVPSTPC